MSEWNVAGTLSRELSLDEEGNVFDIDTARGYGSDDFAMLKPYVTQDCELVINFRSSGYYEPMSMYGGPDNLGWPEEFDDERTPDGASIDGVELPAEIISEIFEIYLEEIKEVELDIED